MATPQTRGTVLATASYALWGLLPLYWKALSGVPASLVLAHRIVWALIFTGTLVTAFRLGAEVRSIFGDRKKLVRMIGAAALISVNWWLYIWAIDAGFVVESALGYYINPLVSVVLGVVFLREKLTRGQALAFGLAAAGVLVLSLGVGHFPFVSIGLALSFGFYGLLKKQATVSALVSLQLETLLSLPLAVALIILSPQGLWGSPEPTVFTVVLLVVAGPVTALPLWLFGAGARLIPMARLGFLQYLSPTITLALGIWVFHESFDSWRALAFGAIWLALLIFTLDSWRRHSRSSS